jgi:glycosyltransferase involved in cell wall biosynthesis
MPEPLAAPQISVIIPALNNFPAITTTLDLVRDALGQHWSYETLVIVNDQVDGPALRDARVHALTADARVRPRALQGGKATAIRWGMEHARGCVIGYIDADAGWEADPGQLRQVIDAVAAGHADCAAAQRDQAHWTPLRRAKTRTFAVLARALLHLPVADTQAPMKFFTRDAAHLLLNQAAWRGWEFDADLLWVLHTAGYRIKPIPVTWKSNGGEASWATVLLLATMAPGMIWNLILLRLTTRQRRQRILQYRS